MSMPRGTKITCPDCNTERNFTIWHSINVDVDPQIREQVKSGKIFEYKCEKCGKTFTIEYRFMYHDCTNKFMVWYFPKKEHDIKEEMEEINKGATPFVFAERINEKIRIVDDKRDLIEKIKIFEDRLDDMIIEIIKLIIKGQVEDENVEIFYNGMKDGDLHFWMSNSKGVGFPYRSYLKIQSDATINAPKKCLLINADTIFDYVQLK